MWTADNHVVASEWSFLFMQMAFQVREVGFLQKGLQEGKQDS